MKTDRGLMSFAIAGLLIGCAWGVAWGQAGLPPSVSGPSVSGPSVSGPGLSEPSPSGPSALAEESPEEEHAEGWTGFVHDHFSFIHKLGQAGAAGMVVNLLVAVLVFLVFRIRGAARAAWRSGHMRVGLVFGVAAMIHGTAIDLAHLADGHVAELLHSGSWLCTTTFLVVLTGLLRLYDRKSPQRWRWLHRLAVIAWVGLLWWHVLPKLF